MYISGFPHSSVGKESACDTGDPGLTPGLGRSAGEGIGYPLQYSWASHVAQLVKNLPAMWETWVQSLGWEDPLEKGKVIHSSILVWRIYSPWGSNSWTRPSDFHFHFLFMYSKPNTKKRIKYTFRGILRETEAFWSCHCYVHMNFFLMKFLK